jgi:hypothetical protein
LALEVRHMLFEFDLWSSKLPNETIYCLWPPKYVEEETITKPTMMMVMMITGRRRLQLILIDTN